MKHKKRANVGRELMVRWLLCQQIGKIFYHSDLSFKELENLEEYFLNIDFLKNVVPIIKRK